MTSSDFTLTTSVVFDAADSVAAAAFWASLTGGSVGDGASADYATVERSGRIEMAFNKVPESKTAKNRMHLDVHVPDLAATEQHATSLGARVVSRHGGWTVLHDPDGNEFCIVAE